MGNSKHRTMASNTEKRPHHQQLKLTGKRNPTLKKKKEKKKNFNVVR